MKMNRSLGTMQEMKDLLRTMRGTDHEYIGMMSYLVFPDGDVYEYVRLLEPKAFMSASDPEKLMNFYSDDMAYAFIKAMEFKNASENQGTQGSDTEGEGEESSGESKTAP